MSDNQRYRNIAIAALIIVLIAFVAIITLFILGFCIGTNSATGPQGAPGAEGAKGPQGQRGSQGQMGEDGPLGDQNPPMIEWKFGTTIISPSSQSPVQQRITFPTPFERGVPLLSGSLLNSVDSTEPIACDQAI